MEIRKIDLSRLRNEEHYSFHNETNDLVVRFTGEALGVQRLYPAYEGFIKELNKRVEKYNNTVEQRKGRSKKDEPEVI
ncbi:MAG: hypothetical protein ACK5HT_00945 [Draconibacterium sp.]